MFRCVRATFDLWLAYPPPSVRPLLRCSRSHLHRSAEGFVSLLCGRLVAIVFRRFEDFLVFARDRDPQGLQRLRALLRRFTEVDIPLGGGLVVRLVDCWYGISAGSP